MLGFQQVLLFAQFPNLFFVPFFNPCGGFFLLLIQTGQFQGIVFAELLFVLQFSLQLFRCPQVTPDAGQIQTDAEEGVRIFVGNCRV